MKLNRPTLRAQAAIRPVGITLGKALGVQIAYRQTTMSPPVNDLWYEVPLDREWMAAYRLAPAGGKPVVAELRIFPAEDLAARPPGEWSGVWRGIHASVPERGLTTRVVALARVHRHLAELPAILKYFAEQGMTHEQLGRFGLTLPKRPTPGRGRKPLPDPFLARVAADYVAAVTAGSAHPLQDVADRHKTPIVVVRGWVYKARQRGLLVGGTWGKAAGVLSPAAAIILRREQQSTRHHRREKGGTRPAAKPGRRRAQTRRRP